MLRSVGSLARVDVDPLLSSDRYPSSVEDAEDEETEVIDDVWAKLDGFQRFIFRFVVTLTFVLGFIGFVWAYYHDLKRLGLLYIFTGIHEEHIAPLVTEIHEEHIAPFVSQFNATR